MGSDCIKRKALHAILWALVIGQLGLIFSMSAQDGGTSGEMSGQVARAVMAVVRPGFDALPAHEQAQIVDDMQYLTRKAGHVGEYALLGLLLYLALGAFSVRRPPRMALAFAGSVLYAAADELHQMAVAGRSPQVTDVMIDAAGALLGIGLALLFLWLAQRRRERRSPS